MKRLISVLGLWLLLAAPIFSQEVQLTVKGKTNVVEVDKTITTVIKEAHTVVQAFPVTFSAPAGAGLYFWTYPANVTAIDKNDSLDVTAAPKGPLTIAVKAIAPNLDKDGKFLGFKTEFGSVTVDIGSVVPPLPPAPDPGPEPTPKPPVPPAPTPTPNPAPIQVAGKRVIIVYKDLGNGKTSMSEKQEDEVYGATLTKYLNTNTTKVDGTAEVRIWPDNIKLANASEVWRQVMGRTRTAPNWIIISDYERNRGYEGPLPDGDGAILNLVKKYLE